MTTHHPRRHPIILLTGTPGTGKTLHSEMLALDADVPLQHLNIGDIVKQHGFHEGWDDEWQSYTVDEDRLLDYLEEVVNPADGPAQTGEYEPSGARRGWSEAAFDGIAHVGADTHAQASSSTTTTRRCSPSVGSTLPSCCGATTRCCMSG